MSPSVSNRDLGTVDDANNTPQKLVVTAGFHNFSHFYIGWPTRTDTWRQNGNPARGAIEDFVLAILRNTTRVTVIIVASGKADQVTASERFSTILSEANKLRFHVNCIPSNDCWLQDTGPTFARSDIGKVVGISFKFNAWGGEKGGCYADYSLDQEFATQLLRNRQLGEVKSNLVIEGGALSTDGRGTLLTTRECLLNENRNGRENAVQLETELRNVLGIRKLIWLPRGAAFDTDTDGHVDNMAVFIAPSTVLLLWADADVFPEQHERSREALAVLREARDADGNRLRIFLVDTPPPLRRVAEEAIAVVQGAKERVEGDVLCASYVNLVMIEDVVIAPKFGHAGADKKAYQQLSSAFKSIGKRVVQVNARELILAGGGLHCISLGEPDAGVL